MASREIRWTVRATQDKLAIYEYWTNRNKSILYARKLEKLFNETMKMTSIFPYSGIKTNVENVRIQVVKDFKLVYRIRAKHIEILKVGDTRQNPKKFNF